MIDRLVNYFRSLGLVDDSNDKIIKYGLRRVCLFLTDFAIILLLSYLLGNIWVGILFELAYSLLRIYAGGFHASKETYCFVLSYSSIIISLYLINYMHISTFLMFIACITMFISIVLLSPIEHKNKPLCKKERIIYRRNTIIILIAELGALFYFNWSHQLLFAKSILAAILLVGLAQWFALLQRNSNYVFHQLEYKILFDIWSYLSMIAPFSF